MPVQTPHPHYQRLTPIWHKERTAIEGEEAVKLAGDVFLPRLEGQSEMEYINYVVRAMFYGAAKRTVQGLVGAILHKDEAIVFPREEMLDTIGQDGRPFEQLMVEQLRETIGIGRFGHLVDAGTGENSQPYIASYYAENIINWRETTLNGRKEPILIVLREISAEPRGDDPFAHRKAEQFRVLKLGAPTIPPAFPEAASLVTPEDRLAAFGQAPSLLEQGPVYFQEIWVENPDAENDSDDERYVHVETVLPRMSGNRILRRIPFTFYNPEDLEPDPKIGPILDLINVNFSHYRNSADLEHGRHFTALPTAWVAGFDPSTTHLKIGSAVAWVTDDAAARAGFLEFTGAGLGHLQEGMEKKEHLMAVLGARLLEEQKTGIEAADTVRLRHSGESSVLSLISQTSARGLSQTLKYVAEWVTPGADASVTLNKDFDTTGIDPRLLAELIKAAQAGLLSWDTFFTNMQKGELVPSGRTPEEELVLIEASRAMIKEAQPQVAAPSTNSSSEEGDGDTEDESLEENS